MHVNKRKDVSKSEAGALKTPSFGGVWGGRTFRGKLLRTKCKLQLVPIKFILAGADDRQEFRQLYFTDSCKVIFYLLMFVFELFFVRQHLPLATAAHTEVLAKWNHPFF